jgi:hypothetical protein
VRCFRSVKTSLRKNAQDWSAVEVFKKSINWEVNVSPGKYRSIPPLLGGSVSPGMLSHPGRS